MSFIWGDKLNTTYVQAEGYSSVPERKPQTNYERELANMTIEKYAGEMSNIDCEYCKIADGCDVNTRVQCKKRWLAWLNEVVK